MKTLHAFVAAVAAATILGGPTSVPAAVQPEIAGTRVPLGCAIIAGKVIVITNTSGGTISAGTGITYNADRTSDGYHFGKTFTSGELAAGATVRKLGSSSASCAAWFTRPTPPAPKQ